MNKQELISRCAEITHDYKADAEKYVNTVFDVITEALETGDDVIIRGFGKFEVRDMKARTGRNPNKTDELYQIPPRKTVKFVSSRLVTERVRSSR